MEGKAIHLLQDAQEHKCLEHLYLTVKTDGHVTWRGEDNRVISNTHCHSSDVKLPHRLMHWYTWSPGDDNCLGKMWNSLGGRACWKKVVDRFVFSCLSLCLSTPPLLLPERHCVRPATTRSPLPTIMECIPLISQNKPPSVQGFQSTFHHIHKQSNPLTILHNSKQLNHSQDEQNVRMFKEIQRKTFSLIVFTFKILIS